MHSCPFSRRTFLAMGGAAMTAPWGLAQSTTEKPVRIAFIGVGNRGSHLLRVMLGMPGVEIPAICDIDETRLNRAIEFVEERHGKTPEGFSKGPYDYRRMLERDDFDAVLLGTPAEWHAEMAVDAMNAGKHVASEVPGAHTIEECWNLVRTCEKTKRHYMLLENYTYEQTRMMVMNMAHAGAFGEMYYAECSYIHDCSDLRFDGEGNMTWRGAAKRDMFGNLYPTHSLGPVSKWMGINRGDRFVSLVSMMSKPASLHEYCVEKFGENSAAADIQWQCGDMNVTLIKTAKDRMITVYYDTDSPRPMSIFYLVQGTKGVFDSRHGIYIRGKSPAHRWEGDLASYHEEYGHPLWKEHADKAAESGHGGGDFFVVREFVDALRENRKPFVDVYDSATWSAVVELSAESIRKGGASVPFPDFTSGAWEA